MATLQEMVKEMARMQEATSAAAASAMAAASSVAASAEVTANLHMSGAANDNSDKWRRPWNAWRSARTQSVGWHEKKMRRAMMYQAGEWPPQDHLKSRIVVEMCQSCGKNQPGQYCVHQVCRGCCEWMRHGTDEVCRQHDNF